MAPEKGYFFTRSSVNEQTVLTMVTLETKQTEENVIRYSRNVDRKYEKITSVTNIILNQVPSMNSSQTIYSLC